MQAASSGQILLTPLHEMCECVRDHLRLCYALFTGEPDVQLATLHRIVLPAETGELDEASCVLKLPKFIHSNGLPERDEFID